ncbi:hypothetical protein EDB83DRAFT_2310533 [Lactarius deliciosus]|nr:hypothetical protein EDB83DRAFT_2310533 [Lactarius deliciosus]
MQAVCPVPHQARRPAHVHIHTTDEPYCGPEQDPDAQVVPAACCAQEPAAAAAHSWTFPMPATGRVQLPLLHLDVTNALPHVDPDLHHCRGVATTTEGQRRWQLQQRWQLRSWQGDKGNGTMTASDDNEYTGNDNDEDNHSHDNDNNEDENHDDSSRDEDNC